MGRGMVLCVALACAALAWPGSANEERAGDTTRELVEAIRALARERAGGGRLELRASCEEGGQGAVHVVIEYPGGAKAEIRDEPPVAQQVEEAPAPARAISWQPSSSRRALEELLEGISALGEDAQHVRVRALSADSRKASRDEAPVVRVRLDLELSAPSQQQALELYARLRELWQRSEALRELERAPVLPLERESGVAVEGLVATYEWPREPLGEPDETPGGLELLVRAAGDGRGSRLGNLALFPREDRTRHGLVDRVLRVEPSDERSYPLPALRDFLGRLERGRGSLVVTGLDLERGEGDRWRFRAEVTRRERTD